MCRLPPYAKEGRADVGGYDAAVQRAESFFNASEMYNLFGNNCHQFAAHAMNLMGYDGKKEWNMIHLAALVLLKGSWVDTWSALKCWGPFAVIMATSAALGWWTVIGGILGTFVALVVYFSAYSFGVAAPMRKVYATPGVSSKAPLEMRDVNDSPPRI